jgi:hypothetical protein
MISMAVVGAKAITGAWDVAAATIEKRTNDRTRYWALTLERKIKGRASGRPGPRIVTGDYRRSFTTEPFRVFGGTGWLVGTNKAQGPRLEHGFNGTDSLGRNYDQPPFPHVKPAADEIDQQYAPDMLRVMTHGL